MTAPAMRLPSSLGQRVGLLAGLWAGAGLVLALGALGWQVAQTGELPRMQFLHLVPALGFAAVSFGLRTLRWHGFLLVAGVRPRLLTSLRTELVGFALTLTPGKLGEVYKCYLMEQATGAPTARTAPIVLFEKLMDGVAFTGLAVLAAAALPGLSDTVSRGAQSLVALGATGLAALLVFKVWRGQLLVLALRVLQRVPIGARLTGILNQAMEGGADVMKLPIMARNMLLSLIARSCDGLAMMWVASAVGISLSPLAGIFALNSAGAIGGFSMLPGGIGVVEAGLSLLLISLGATPGAAITATLLARVFSFWLWVAIGLGLLAHFSFEVRGRSRA